MTDSVPAAGIYVHIPFCIRKCRYCDFYSVTDISLKADFMETLCREIAGTTETFPVDSLYIGGGTPSILEPGDIGRILDCISGRFRLDSSAEITLEINPGTVSPGSLIAYRKNDVNRLNIGVQSFRENWLKWLGRLHSAEAATNAFQWARDAGFDSIGLDLIYGIPGQNQPAWIDDLHRAISLNPEHLSCYMLTCESGTPLDSMRHTGEFVPMADADVGALFETTVMELSQCGYPLYEISNFARVDGHDIAINRSRHNQKYWIGAPYLGFGPAAHSYINPVRYRNHRNILAYLTDVQHGRSPIDEKEILDTEQRLMETIFLGLRTGEGISIPRFEAASGRSFFTMFQDILTDPELAEYIIWTPEHCALTLRGMMVMDAIAGLFIDRL